VGTKTEVSGMWRCAGCEVRYTDTDVVNINFCVIKLRDLCKEHFAPRSMFPSVVSVVRLF
jgi:hypothetical protein